MKTRLASSLAVAALLALPLAGRAQEREWEEDYSNGWSDDGSEPVDVQVDADNTPTATLDQSFDSGLQPYGSWVTVSSYGRVWRPQVSAGWRPYYYGRWEWTNEGWLWVSDEPFGWATYHYGRWSFEPSYGWVWVPGYQWAPAWVSWRTSGDVIGWSPLSPGFSLYLTSYPFVDFYWTFMPCNAFVSYPVYRYAYPHDRARDYFYRTAPAPARNAPRAGPTPNRGAPVPAWGGPSPRLVEDRTGRRVSPVRVVSGPTPGSASRPGEVSIYRPGRPVREGRDAYRGPVPSRGSRDVGPWTQSPVRDGGSGWSPPRPADRGVVDRGSRGGHAPQPGPRMQPAPQPQPRMQAPQPQPRMRDFPQPIHESGRSPSHGGWTTPSRTLGAPRGARGR
ncbi:MAG: hypothetical protein QM704_18115 [Anaeromyxobacteraceae bacterium]